MGFRDMHVFNLAMLGKNGWRLLTKPESLCARVLKGKYYPHTDFLNASAPSRASATWKAIIAGRKALDVGLIKRVGDDSTICTWIDPWILGNLSLKPMSRIGSSPLATVSELIDDYTGNWNVEIIQANFLPQDVEAILNIPLNSNGGEDFLAWALEKSGNYSVKSVYRSLVTQNEHRALEEGTITEASSTNKQMWNAL